MRLQQRTAGIPGHHRCLPQLARPLLHHPLVAHCSHQWSAVAAIFDHQLTPSPPAADVSRTTPSAFVDGSADNGSTAASGGVGAATGNPGNGPSSSDNNDHNSSSTSRESSTKGGVYIQAAHPTSMGTSRAAHWALLQELVPRKDWQNTAVVLACLESIYRAEYLQFGQDALAALQAANAACLPTDPLAPSNRGSSPSRGSSPARASSLDDSSKAGTPARTDSVQLQDGRILAISASNASATAGVEANRLSTQSTNGNSSSSSSSPVSREQGEVRGPPLSEAQPLQQLEPESLTEAAARLDAELAALLNLLTQRAHFEPLTLRDVEVAKTLNRDWTLQLFIAGDTRRCDRSLVQAVRTAAAAMQPRAAGTRDGAAAAFMAKSAAAAHDAGRNSPEQLLLDAAVDAAADLMAMQATGPGSFDWAQPLPPSSDADGGAADDSTDSTQPSEALPVSPLALDDILLSARNQRASSQTREHHYGPASAAHLQPGQTAQDAAPHLHQQQQRQQDQEQGAQASQNGHSFTHGSVEQQGPQQLSTTSARRAAATRAGVSSTHASPKGTDATSVSMTSSFSSLSSIESKEDMAARNRSRTRDSSTAASVQHRQRLITRLADAARALLGAELFSPSLLDSRHTDADSLGAATQPWGSDLLPPESEALLLFKREYGEVESTGRLLVQKLDYLQTLLVSLVLDSIRSGAASGTASMLDWMTRSLASMAELDKSRYRRSLHAGDGEVNSDMQADSGGAGSTNASSSRGSDHIAHDGSTDQATMAPVSSSSSRTDGDSWVPSSREDAGHTGPRALAGQQDDAAAVPAPAPSAPTSAPTAGAVSLAVTAAAAAAGMEETSPQLSSEATGSASSSHADGHPQPLEGQGQIKHSHRHQQQQQRRHGRQQQRQATEQDPVQDQAHSTVHAAPSHAPPESCVATDNAHEVVQRQQQQQQQEDLQASVEAQQQQQGQLAVPSSDQHSSTSSTSTGVGVSHSQHHRQLRRSPLRSGWLVRAMSDNVAALSRTWGTKLLGAGRMAAGWLSERGVGPRMDVMSLSAIDATYPVVEPPRLPPLFLRKVALAEVFGPHPFSQPLGSLARLLVQPVKLQQPTLKEFVVMYRKTPKHARRARAVAALQRVGRALRVLPEAPEQPPQPRPPVHIRVYRDLPLPTWQLALPDKLLQFRPLDLLRADVFALVGLMALLAQAKYESLLLDIITIVSASVFLVRIALGFKRMDDRYRNQVAEVLREKTIASEGPAIEYLAAAAGLQQFKQASLAYLYALQKQTQQAQQGQPGDAASAPASTGNGVNPTHSGTALGVPNSAQRGPHDAASSADDGMSGASATHASVGQHRKLHTAASESGLVNGNLSPTPPSPSTASTFQGASNTGMHRYNGSSRGQQEVVQPRAEATSLPASAVANPEPVSLAPMDGQGALCMPEGGPWQPHDQQGVEIEELAMAMEQLLRSSCSQQVRFDAEEAVAELERLGLAEVHTATITAPMLPVSLPSRVPSEPATASSSGSASEAVIAGDAAGGPSLGQLIPSPAPTLVWQSSLPQARVVKYYKVVDTRCAMRLVQQHWDGLLWQRVDGILREFE